MLVINPHAVAAVLLETLAGLEGGLMTAKLYEAFVAAISARPEQPQCAAAEYRVGQRMAGALLTRAAAAPRRRRNGGPALTAVRAAPAHRAAA